MYDQIHQACSDFLSKAMDAAQSVYLTFEEKFRWKLASQKIRGNTSLLILFLVNIAPAGKKLMWFYYILTILTKCFKVYLQVICS